MGNLAERMLAATSKPQARVAVLALEDGTCFRGNACGASGEAFGEVCFNTSVEGYLEVVSDPSYAGQIVVMTYPQIGNYGICLEDAQAEHPALRGLVVRNMCCTPSNWRSDITLPDYLEREGVIAIEGVDTRALVQHVRDHGAMRAVLSTEDLNAESLVNKARASESIVGVNLAQTVSCAEPHVFKLANEPNESENVSPTHSRVSQREGKRAGENESEIRSPTHSTKSKAFALTPPKPVRYRVVAYDCGIKRSILEELVRVGCEVTLVPWDTPATDVLAMAPDGVFLSNGPGDPDAVAGTYQQVELLLGKVPIFGICLGHQMICKAAGGHIQKLKFGHHGGNQPVVNLLTGRVEITAQNHGFNLVFPSLGPLMDESENVSPTHPRVNQRESKRIGENESEIRSPTHPDDLRVWVERGIAPVAMNPRYGGIRLTHVNLNDGTAEGIAFTDIPAFSVQYHPEANPGPADSHYLFTAFARLMDGREDYLDIDIAKDRLEGWRF